MRGCETQRTRSQTFSKKAKQRILDGQDHSAAYTNPGAVAAALVEFFAAESADR